MQAALTSLPTAQASAAIGCRPGCTEFRMVRTQSAVNCSLVTRWWCSCHTTPTLCNEVPRWSYAKVEVANATCLGMIPDRTTLDGIASTLCQGPSGKDCEHLAREGVGRVTSG